MFLSHNKLDIDTPDASDIFFIIDVNAHTKCKDVAPVWAYTTRAILYAIAILLDKFESGFFINVICILCPAVVNKKNHAVAWAIKKNTTEVVIRICAVYVMYIIINSTKSQDNIFKPVKNQRFTRLFHHHKPINTASHDAKPMRHFRLSRSAGPIRHDI